MLTSYSQLTPGKGFGLFPAISLPFLIHHDRSFVDTRRFGGWEIAASADAWGPDRGPDPLLVRAVRMSVALVVMCCIAHSVC